MRLILGAGCSGLALARALLDAGTHEPITLVDRRRSFEHDRTWCFWQTDPPVPRSGVASAGWNTWRLIGADGTVVERSSARHPYVQVRADDYYADSLRQLEASEHVRLVLGERVLGIDDGPNGRLAVRTSAGVHLADRVFEAMGGGGPLSSGRPAGAIELRQSFLGLEVETSAPAFDPGVATLMDFRTDAGASGGDGLHFMYVLPTSPTRALVEHTTLGPRTVPPAVRRAAIATYLRRHHGVRRHEVLREERGNLPMSTHTFPVARGPRVQVVGAAAGAVRPSSGYAFVRIQHHADAVAQAAVHGAAFPERVGRARHGLLDHLFLRALAVDPPAFAATLLRLAARTDADTFARFMSDASSVADELAVMRALAGPDFLVPMIGSSMLRPITRSGRPAAG